MFDDIQREKLIQYKQAHVDNCPNCKGSDSRCACRLGYERFVHFIAAQIPLAYVNLTMADLTAAPPKAKEVVNAYIASLDKRREDGRGLYLWGTTGTAKTTFGCIILKEALEKGYSAQYTTLDKIIELLLTSWRDYDKKQEYEYLSQTRFLLIDDIGGLEIKTRGNKEIIETALTTLFKYRTNQLLPTIITSNLSLTQLQDTYGQRLFSAMHERLQFVECSGVDFREEIISKSINDKESQ